MKTIYTFIILFFSSITFNANAIINDNDLKMIMPNATSFNLKNSLRPILYYAYNNNQLIGICYNSTDVYTKFYWL